MEEVNGEYEGERNRGFKEERFFLFFNIYLFFEKNHRSRVLIIFFPSSGFQRLCRCIIFRAVPHHRPPPSHSLAPLSTLSIVNFSDYCRIGTTTTSFHSTKCRFTILPLSSTTFRYVCYSCNGKKHGERKFAPSTYFPFLSFPFLSRSAYSEKSAPRSV